MKPRTRLFVEQERYDPRPKIGDPLVGLAEHMDFAALAARIAQATGASNTVRVRLAMRRPTVRWHASMAASTTLLTRLASVQLPNSNPRYAMTSRLTTTGSRRKRVHKTPLQVRKDWHEKWPELFRKREHDHPGLDMYS